MVKKRWERPQLVVLVRTRPEEHCLQNCKEDCCGATPQGQKLGCEHEQEGHLLCNVACSGLGS